MRIEEIGGAFRAYPGFLPGLAVAVVVALLLNRSVGARLGMSRLFAAALIVSLGMIMAATLMPGGDPPHSGGSCDLSRFGPPPLDELLELGSITLNIILFVPLGTVLGLLTRSRTKAWLVAAAVALPFCIELVQFLIPPLERKCQSADVFDNLMGLVAGLVVGTIAGRITERRA